LPVEKQVLIIYAGNRGYLDGIPVAEVRNYEKKLYDHFEKTHTDILTKIREKKHIDTALDGEISVALRAFNEIFQEGLK
jgi:F-type H+-transporting ATPase subunit alpha